MFNGLLNRLRSVMCMHTTMNSIDARAMCRPLDCKQGLEARDERYVGNEPSFCHDDGIFPTARPFVLSVFFVKKTLPAV